MKKIYSVKERLIGILVIVLLGIVLFMLMKKFYSNIGTVILAYACIVLIVLVMVKLFFIPCHIAVTNNRIKIFDFPLLATNKFFDRNRGLILWNSEIDIQEIKKVELVKLTKKEKLKYIGHNHLFSQYIRVSLKNSNVHKYIYVSNYSYSQVKRILSVLTGNIT